MMLKQGLSGTPAEAGVRGFAREKSHGTGPCLSGTPAEAGVRVEAPESTLDPNGLSGTPAEAGVRVQNSGR